MGPVLECALEGEGNAAPWTSLRGSSGAVFRDPYSLSGWTKQGTLKHGALDRTPRARVWGLLDPNGSLIHGITGLTILTICIFKYRQRKEGWVLGVAISLAFLSGFTKSSPFFLLGTRGFTKIPRLVFFSQEFEWHLQLVAGVRGVGVGVLAWGEKDD